MRIAFAECGPEELTRQGRGGHPSKFHPCNGFQIPYLDASHVLVRVQWLLQTDDKLSNLNWLRHRLFIRVRSIAPTAASIRSLSLTEA